MEGALPSTDSAGLPLLVGWASGCFRLVQMQWTMLPVESMICSGLTVTSPLCRFRWCIGGEDEMEKVNLENAKQQYAGQWLAFLVTEETPAGELLGQIIAHNRDRRDLHRELRERKIERAYVTYAGPPVKPGYVVIL